MFKRTHLVLMLTLISILAIGMAACSSGAAEEEAPPPPPVEEEAAEEEPAEAAEEPEAEEEPAIELVGDSIRGGLMYDKWWTVVGVDAPEEDHPLWSTQTTNERSGGDTWRCKECHGWDYEGAEGAYSDGSHFTGFIGVSGAADSAPAEVLAWLDGSTNADHDFSGLMDEQALIDVTLFLTGELVDNANFIGEDKASLGTASGGEDLYQDSCSDCHGPEGNGFNFSDDADPDYLGGLSNGNPWETLHKMRFGQPSEPDMPSAIDDAWTEQEIADVLAYAQTLPNSAPVAEGGRMYDKWWSALGLDEPTDDHPLWATQTTNERSGGDTWRCKECHGWDYQGADGAYGSGSHFTGFTGVFAASSQTGDELAAWLNGKTNSDHDFSAFLSEEQIAVMATFLQEGVTDVAPFINDDKTVNGDADNGQELYNRYCERCHGEDGTDINFGDDDDPEYAGTIAVDNPWEFIHKARFGQPDEDMVSLNQMGVSLQDVADIAAYAQSFPTE